MGTGKSKVGGGSGAMISYDDFMHFNDEQKDNFILQAIDNVVVPDGVKDTPTMRVLVALGMDGRPTMVSDNTLDSMPGKDYFRTVTDAYDLRTQTAGKNASQIVDEFTKGRYSSMSDQNGSSEGRGYYFAENLSGATFWGDDTAKTMRAKVKPGTKMLDIDDVLYGSKRKAYIADRRLNQELASKGVMPWDGLSIWAIKHGYKGGHATDSGTGAREIVMFDRSALNVSKAVKNLKKNEMKWR